MGHTYEEMVRIADAAHKSRTVQQVNDKSCQPCGCDEGANHLCAQHYVPREEQTIAYPSMRWFDQEDQEADVNDYQQSRDANRPADLPGIGGAPTRNTTLPTDGAERKKYPVATGVLDYFPDAIAELANVSWKGNEQHHKGKPLHWDRSKSADESDTMIRHFLQRGTFDTDGTRHTAKMAWRALAILQKEIEQEGQ
jgi:hypothetical protein